MPPCLPFSIIIYVSMVKLSNPGNEVAPSPTLQCSSYWKGSFPVALDYGQPTTFYVYTYPFWLYIMETDMKRKELWPAFETGPSILFPAIITVTLNSLSFSSSCCSSSSSSTRRSNCLVGDPDIGDVFSLIRNASQYIHTYILLLLLLTVEWRHFQLRNWPCAISSL